VCVRERESVCVCVRERERECVEERENVCLCEVHRRGVEHEALVLRCLGVLGVVQPADSQVMRPSQVVSLIAHLLIRAPEPSVERAGAGNEFFIDNLLLRIHYHRDDWMEIKSLKRQSRSYRSYTAGIKVYRVEVFSYNRNAF